MKTVVYAIIDIGGLLKEVKIYCDGGSSGNPGPSGIGVVILIDNKVKIHYGEYIGVATNNIAELTSVLRALQLINHLLYPIFALEICSDSRYALESIKGTFQGKKNLDLIHKIRKEIGSLEITYTKVKGHAEDKYNILADTLVHEAINNR